MSYPIEFDEYTESAVGIAEVKDETSMHLCNHLGYNSMSIRVSIIGTAGRDTIPLTKDIYNAMIVRARQIIYDEFKLAEENVMLVSGGSAWSDHVAVTLWFKGNNTYRGLTLYLPCPFTNGQFVDNGKRGSIANPGPRLNQLHGQFSQAIGRNTLCDLTTVRALGGVLDETSNGFHARNTQVAKSELLIAFSWGTDPNMPEDGGTKDTWNKCRGRKVHVPIHTLLL